VPSSTLIRRGPFRATLARIPGKGGWTYVKVPTRLVPPVTRAWGRTPIRATIDGVAWTTSLWRSKDGSGFLPVPKRVRGDKEAGTRVVIAFEFDDD
jgi:hypothetical protein